VLLVVGVTVVEVVSELAAVVVVGILVAPEEDSMLVDVARGIKKLLDDVEGSMLNGLLLVLVTAKTPEELLWEHPGVSGFSSQYLSMLMPRLQLSHVAVQA
jgi:hypothetical protein